MSATIYVGWTATPYNWVRSGAAVSPYRPLFEMTLERSSAPVILRGIVRQDRAWCRVLEFDEERGISLAYDPFRLLERRGG